MSSVGIEKMIKIYKVILVTFKFFAVSCSHFRLTCKSDIIIYNLKPKVTQKGVGRLLNPNVCLATVNSYYPFGRLHLIKK